MGLIAGPVPRSRHVTIGPLFGDSVWLSGYALLPAAGLYKPIWEYGPRELVPDLAAHPVYGTITHRVASLLGAAA